MGGLLARRYMVRHPGEQQIGKFITVAAPWLGAPKAINVLEIGAFQDGFFGFLARGTFKRLSEYYPGMHELLPSRKYFDIVGYPLNVNGQAVTDYDQFALIMDKRYPNSKPGLTNRAFHDAVGQDSSREGPFPEQYFHYVGNTLKLETIASVNMLSLCSPFHPPTQCTFGYTYDYTSGDKTVPRNSARRGFGTPQDLNAAGATVRTFIGPTADSVRHLDLVKNPTVLNAIYSDLRSNQSSQTPEAGAVVTVADTDPPLEPAYLIKLMGVASILVSDASSKATNPFSDPPDAGLPNTSSYVTGPKSVDVILPLDQRYSVTFLTGTDPIGLSITRETEVADQAIRYQDLILPTNIQARIQLTPQGIGSLSYDANGDGTFETTIQPTVSVSGTAANDVTSPTVAIQTSPQGNLLSISINASDTESGVKTIYYSLNGATFSSYTTPLVVDPYSAPAVYAFADDNVANRSGLVTYYPSITPNQLDNAQFFVRQHYLDFLSREPDSSGLAFWTNEITSCGSSPSCIELKRINVSAAYYLSIEFQDTGYLVERIYKTAYGDASGTSTFGGTHQLSVPIVRLNEFLPDTQAIGNGVIVGQTGWEQALENNKQAFASEFVQRSRFTTAFPASMTPAEFVATLNLEAGSPLSQSERNQLVSDLSTGMKTRAQVLRAVAEHPNLINAEFNRAFVLMQFFGYLRRNPNDPQDTDYTGYDFWLTKLNQFNGNFVSAEMVKAFIVSGEYRGRFGP
jgi:hypothetical protein